MPRTAYMDIQDVDVDFEHLPVKVVANRSCPEIKLVGLSVGPFEEGNEYEVQFWIAEELEKTGIARFREEERLDAAGLYKIQWTERVQTAGQICKLPENFYPKLRRHLIRLKEDTAKAPEKLNEYEKNRQLTQDVVNLRLKKIVSLASAPPQTEQILKNLTLEERFLYEQLYKLIYNWRTQILEYKETKE